MQGDISLINIAEITYPVLYQSENWIEFQENEAVRNEWAKRICKNFIEVEFFYEKVDLANKYFLIFHHKGAFLQSDTQVYMSTAIKVVDGKLLSIKFLTLDKEYYSDSKRHVEYMMETLFIYPDHN